jgi:hypothetical protein
LLAWGTQRAPALFSRPTFSRLYDVPEKPISVDMAAGVAPDKQTPIIKPVDQILTAKDQDPRQI